MVIEELITTTSNSNIPTNNDDNLINSPPTNPSIELIISNLNNSISNLNSNYNLLPSSSELNFESSLSKPLSNSLKLISNDLFNTVENLLDWIQPAATEDTEKLDKEMIKEGYYSSIIERVDKVLESIDDTLESTQGVKKSTLSAIGASSSTSTSTSTSTTTTKRSRSNTPIPSGSTTKLLPLPKPPLAPHLLHSPHLPKPQLFFPKRLRIPIPSINSQTLPLWTPVLQYKLHSVVSPWLLIEEFIPELPHPMSTTPCDPARIRYAHPYKTEYTLLAPPSHYFNLPPVPIPHAVDSFDTVPFSYIDTVKGFEIMLKEIREMGEVADRGEGGKDLAIDLEHHSLRSWSGMSSLIQLSTRKKDYVIDCLKPEIMENLERMNEFFTDPTWIKVFHGANSDIIWLQRDFGLYIVGLFDTYHATKVLDFPQHSLASLLAKYTNFVPDKRYQLADWRIRPIPEEMLHYARSDTHFLLSIYDKLRIALHALPTPPPTIIEPREAGSESEAEEGRTIVHPIPLQEVFNRSIITSSNVFEILPYTPLTGLHKGWRHLLSKWHVSHQYEMALSVPTLPHKSGWGPGEIKLEVLKSLHYWRESIAREEDESVEFILSNKALEELSRNPTRDEVEILILIGKSYGGISEIVRKRKGELINAIEEGFHNVTVGIISDKPRVEEERSEVITNRGIEAVEPVVQTLPGLWDSPSLSLTTSSSSLEVIPMEVEEVVPEVTVAKSIFSSMFGGGSNKKKVVVSTPIVISSTDSLPSTSTSIAPVITAPKSSLFAAASSIFGGSNGKKKSKKVVEEVVISSTSSMIEKGKGKEVVNSDKEDARLSAIARIHASLVLGGGLADSLKSQSIPEVIQESTPLASTINTSNPTTANDEGEQEDISMDHSYVPLSGRMPKPSTHSTISSSSSSSAPVSVSVPIKSKSDVIIVSSLADKPKKRRRVKELTQLEQDELTIQLPGTLSTYYEDINPTPLLPSLPSIDSPSKEERRAKKIKKSSLSKSIEPSEKLEPFDYSNVKSILDAEPQAGRTFAGGKKDKKKEVGNGAGGNNNKKGFEVDVSGFRKSAPRVNNAPKRGNVSKSFEK